MLFAAIFFTDQRNGAVGRAFTLQSVDLEFISLVKSYQKTLEYGIESFPTWHLAFKGWVENIHESLFVVSLGKALNTKLLCERQVAQTPRKWQLPSKCKHLVQKTAIQQNLPSCEWRINMGN